jgi:putative transposase
MQRKDYLHNPTHIFIDNTVYFITAATYQKQHLLKDAALKYKLLDCIQETFARYQWELQHWVILNNHYHLLAKSYCGKDLAAIMRQVHSVSAYHIKQVTKTPTQVWWNYWDYCPRNEQDYYSHLNYLFNNPIKHAYVTNLRDYAFSSFNETIAKQGRELLIKQFKAYEDYKSLVLNEDDF